MTRTIRLWSVGRIPVALGVLLVSAGSALGQVDFSVYRSLGDSLTHGTQGGKVVDHRTQPFAYPVYLADKAGASFALPLLTQAAADETQSRLDAPNFSYGANLAVNGADLHEALYHTADALVPPGYKSKDLTDCVLAPRTGATQVSAAVSDGATFTTVWLGGNDFLNSLSQAGTVLHDFYGYYGLSEPVEPLNVSGITDQASFATDYADLMNTLMAVPGMKMAVANLPVINNLAAVLDKDQVTALVGSNPMPEHAMTNELVVAAIMYDDVGTFGADIWDVDMLANPDNYWDANEATAIDAAITGFNATIASQAGVHDVALVDFHGLLTEIEGGQYSVGGWELNDEWFVANVGQEKASFYSSDGLHPSDIGHAVVANAFIDAINDHYGSSIQRLSEAEQKDILDHDRFVDNDLDGRIEGITSNVAEWTVNFFVPDYTGDAPDIPEPTSLALFASGGILALSCRRHRAPRRH